MAWAEFVDGKFLPIHGFEGSVNEKSYIKMLEDKVWPSVKHSASTAYTTNAVLFYLKYKFQGRNVSHKAEFS